MAHPASRLAVATGGGSAVAIDAGAHPLPADVDDAQGGRHLDGHGKGAEHHPPHRVLVAGRGDPCQQQAPP